ncbi:glycosyltransferase family 4 protein [Rhodococcoides corynebacterioides]|uniref:Glycosyltransferase family 4 protein n=1 Tax=Rhodococcoides corynebacterioides TaxID=53972 RepID=A0ABS7NZJ2_9NOCA|nr:glycosyltransferase family 4 protein [Rhodococcus corynebacterioides]MBY6365549.1 glycosyltransferase family 4 protein [Rhodococcus corynebacterioides]MBY6406280.1 glycosyltransferase family 4 protein [Rhodococcus corynebacterioides]
MRIALLSYRSKPHVGGQGVYVARLGKALVEAGHIVEVFSGQPYPVLDPRITLTRVPSLDLYREPDPFRTPRPSEIRDWIDVIEVATMWTAGFPEPLTFGLRAARLLSRREADFDVVHDNQSLSYGLLRLRRPWVATIHHPITRDRELDLAGASWRRRITLRRWYGFLAMQRRVARRVGHVITVSRSSADDIVEAFGVRRTAVSVIPLGVDTTVFAPRGERVPGRIVAVASADVALKGVRHLLEAVAKLRTERDVTVDLVSTIDPEGPTRRTIDRLGLGDAVTVRTGLTDDELADVLARAEVACVPSLYEGFSLPTVEAMSCGTPLVVSRTGAIPEVVGPDGECADLVDPGDSEALAAALSALLGDDARRAEMGRRGRARAESTFSWPAVAAATVDVYGAAIAAHHEGDHAC